MFAFNKWRHIKGDGREEAIVYEGDIFWVPLNEVRNTTDALKWIVKVSEAGWSSKSDLANLTEMLLDHIESIREHQEDRRAEKNRAVKEANLAALGAAARLAASMRSSPRQPLKNGTTWGEWTYHDEHGKRPWITYGIGYRIAVDQINTPDGLSGMVQHLSRKEHFDAKALADGVEALIVCSASAKAESGE